MLRAASIAAVIGLAGLSMARGFTEDERSSIVAFWNEPGRYESVAPAWASQTGPFQVRLTVAGSTWLWNYNKARGIGKVPPTQGAAPQNSEQEGWQKWIDAKIAYDRWLAAESAYSINARVLGKDLTKTDKNPGHPGPAPDGLVKLAGNPPSFAEPIAPIAFTVRFEDAEIAYEDNVNMRPNYAYYRFEQGVMVAGKRVRDLPKSVLTDIFKNAGLSESEQKVMASVSMLEGGFESVNTYDTGFVSVGLIQFACLKDGAGALGRMLRTYKQRSSDDFESDFRKFGIDVEDDGRLVAVDPSTGAELTGPSAAIKIIEDKRLIAVFQRAGAKSDPFRVAQIVHAKNEFFPGNDALSVNLGGRSLNFKVGDIFRSEAGLATLMDRKVNTGSIEPLGSMIVLVAAQNGLNSLDELRKFERDLIVAMRYRKDYLEDKSLTQPGPAKTPNRDYRSLLSRSGKRGGRKGGSR